MSDTTDILMTVDPVLDDAETSSPQTSPICPGERALFPNQGGSHYLRTVFTVYWMNACPSSEIFYLTERPFKLTPTSIAELESSVLALLVSELPNATPLNVVYICFSGVEMSVDEVAAADWHVITGL